MQRNCCGIDSAGIEQRNQRVVVHAAERLNICKCNAFVNLVDGLIDGAELDKLRTDSGDETSVRGAAGGG